MFFEGSEKKVEIIVDPSSQDLRTLGRDFWAGVVARSHAQLLSSIENPHCDAYLLSESSLFVWSDRFLMITCGITSLVDAVLHFVESFGSPSIQFACYQRKNEYLPRQQRSSFKEDLERLQPHLPGKAYRLGSLDSHHHYLFHLDRPYQATADDTTCELLMYHIEGEVAEYLRSPDLSPEGIRRSLKLDAVLGGFQLDDFVFSPFGYSLNAIRDDRYATIHITPQSENSYVSFECNLPEPAEALQHFVGLLKPGSWDIMTFNCQPPPPQTPSSQRLGRHFLPLRCGFDVRFEHFQQRENQQQKVFPLD